MLRKCIGEAIALAICTSLVASNAAASDTGFLEALSDELVSPSAVVPVPGGGYLLAGTIGVMKSKPIVIRLDGAGEVLWRRELGVAAEESGRQGLMGHPKVGGIAFGPDGNLVLLLNSDVYAKRPLHLIHLDESGTELRRAALPFPGINDPKSLLVRKDGRLLIGFDHKVENRRTVLLARVRPSGEVDWKLELSGEKYIGLEDVVLTGDGGCVASALAMTEAGGTIRLVKVDSKGKQLWNIRVGADLPGKHLAKGVVVDQAGNYLVAGSLWFPSGDFDPILAKVDAQGRVLWVNPYNEDGVCRGYYPVEHSSGKIALAIRKDNDAGPGLVLLAVGADGTKIGSRPLGGEAGFGWDPLAAAIDATGHLLITGTRSTPSEDMTYTPFLRAIDLDWTLDVMERYKKKREARGERGERTKRRRRRER